MWQWLEIEVWRWLEYEKKCRVILLKNSRREKRRVPEALGAKSLK